LLLLYWFTTENISDKAQTYHRMIAPYVSQSTGDRAFFGEAPMFPPEAFTNSWQDLVSFVGERSTFLKSQLQNE
jgi:hypothetical protein